MFENVTYDFILEKLLSKIPGTFDKRTSSPVYHALAPAALELAEAYIYLDMVLEEGFADTASYYYLIKRAAERNIYPKEAKKAMVRGEFVPADVEIPMGERFRLNDLNYIVQSKTAEGVYRLQCETEGAVGNQQLGIITPIGTVMNLESGRITEVLIPGEDEEEIEVFRNRYYASFDAQAFGGNEADYKEKVKKLQGVGGVKVIPAWVGGGTVKLIILNSEGRRPSGELIESIQNEVDPTVRSGEGMGFAPIGHRVTVFGVKEALIDIETNITCLAGYTKELLLPLLQEAADDYFAELSESWEGLNRAGLVIYISKLEARFLDVEGVLDVSGTKLNREERNLVLDADAIPQRGALLG